MPSTFLNVKTVYGQFFSSFVEKVSLILRLYLLSSTRIRKASDLR